MSDSAVDLEVAHVSLRCRARHVLAAILLVGCAAVADAQVTLRASVDSAGVEGNSGSGGASMSRNGRFVAFRSQATNLVPNDQNGWSDIFVFDRNVGTTECVSVDPSGATGNGLCPSPPAVSDDGRFVAFVSWSTNLVSGRTTSLSQVFLRDRWSGTTELISQDASGNEGDNNSNGVTMSPDGRFIVFDSYSENLVLGDTNGNSDVLLFDRSTGVMELVSVDSSGIQGDSDSEWPAVTPDGSIVAFVSIASNLVAGDANGVYDGFFRHRTTGSTERVTLGQGGAESNDLSIAPTPSADGHLVLFQSLADNLVPGDSNSASDVFVRDVVTGVVERVSVDSAGNEGNGSSGSAYFSDDGRFVAFTSDASNLVAGDSNGDFDAFVHDRSTGSTRLVSVDSSGNQGNDLTYPMSISADGRAVAMVGLATNLVSNDTNGNTDVFVRDEHLAAWSNYGSGFPGTHGIPSLTCSADPILGTTFTVDLQNSLGSPTVGLLLVGTQQANLPTHFGGVVLVLPTLVAPVSFSYGVNSFSVAAPFDVALAGVVIDVQAVEADPGAASGVSFTAGLELAFGF